MNYVQLKESTIQLTACLKILPDEDKMVIKRLLSKYKKQTKVFANVDFTNEVFSKPEWKMINRVVLSFINRKTKPFRDQIKKIEEDLCVSSGSARADTEWYTVYCRLQNIFQKRYCNLDKYYREARNDYHGTLNDFMKQSKVFNCAVEKLNKTFSIYEKMEKESIDYKNTQKKWGKMEKELEGFSIKTETKNHIVMRGKLTNVSLSNVALETIMNEIESQFINKQKQGKL